MFDALLKILSIVFKPLFDTSKEALLKSSDPRRRMTRALIKLYDELEAIEYWSEKLLTDTDTYISKEWVAWTVARNKRAELMSSSKELTRATINLGKSLQQLYSMFSIRHPELLTPLVDLFSSKQAILRNPLAAPEIVDLSNDPKVGALTLILPKRDVSERELSALIHEFRFDSANTVKNYLLQIDVDGNKEQVAELIKQSRPILMQIEHTKAKLRDFIQQNVSIEDFFK